MLRILKALVAAVTAGVVVGLVARFGMGLVALAAGDSVHFTVAGTVSIVMTYAVAMVPGALVASFTRRLRWLVPAAGGLFLVVPAIGVASEEIGDLSGLSGPRMAFLHCWARRCSPRFRPS